MKASVLARRYAKALFELALERDILEVVSKELVAFQQLLATNDRLRYFFESPEAGRSAKRALIEKNFQDHFSALFVNFLYVLLEKRRHSLLDHIAKEFARLSDKHQNLVRASTISAVPLSKQDLENIKKVLGKHYQATFEIENYVDPRILGGIILKVEGRVMDGSILTQLENMKASINTQRN